MILKFYPSHRSNNDYRGILSASICVGALLLVGIACPAWAEFRVPGTGITKCYDDSSEIECPSPGQPYYGQDANYKGRQPSYRDNGDGTVTDQVTGLTWQQANDDVARVWDDAVFYCQDLDLGGYTDWRLPPQRELLTIVDYGRYIPAINPIFNTYPNQEVYCSGSTYAGNSFFVWSVLFSGYGPSALQYVLQPSEVRCVRGGSLPESVFVDNGNGTVSDRSTGLVWEKAGSDVAVSWEVALAWCENIATGGYTDWRLPNINELNSVVDYSRIDPAIDPVFSASSSFYWSGSTFVKSVSQAWYVSFEKGNHGYNSKFLYAAYVRCVRGGQGAYAPGAVDMLLLDGQ